MKKEDLIPNKTYVLKHTGQFCHCVGLGGFRPFSKRDNSTDRIKAKFIGIVTDGTFGDKAIFLGKTNKRQYIMFSADKIDYIETARHL